MHPAQIKAALAMRGHTQAQVAAECGVEPTTVSAVINGRGRSQQIERRIALVTGQALADLWPDWYGAQANRRRRRPMSMAAVTEALRALG